MSVQHRDQKKSLEEVIGRIAYNYQTRVGSDYNDMFGTAMPQNMLVWLQSWAAKRFPEMLKEEHEAEIKIENAPRNRYWRRTKSVVIFFVGTIVGAYILRLLGLC